MTVVKKKYGSFRNMIYVTKGFFKYSKAEFFCMLFSAIFSSFSTIFATYITKWILEGIIDEIETKSLLILVLSLILIKLISDFLKHIFTSEMEMGFIYPRLMFALDVSKKSNEIDLELLERQDVLDQRDLALQAVSSNYDGIEGLMRLTQGTLYSFIKMIVTTVTLSFLDIRLIAVSICLCLLQYIAFRRTIKKDKKISWDLLPPFWRKVGYLRDVSYDFAFGKDIRLFNIVPYLNDKSLEANKGANNLITKSKKLWIFYGVMVNIVSFCVNAIVYSYIVFQTYLGNINIADCLFYIGNMMIFFGALNDFLYSLGGITRCSLETDEYRAFMNIAVEKVKPINSISELQKNFIEFKDVSFKYPGQDVYALKNFSIKIPFGQKLAVVGINGAGKSTFIKLLLRMYHPLSGQITIDGIDIEGFDKNEYFTLFSPVFQNVNLFALPLFSNVSSRSKEETDMNLVFDCLKKAGLEENVKSLSLGLDTPLLKIIDDNGVDLSGGEKQKLALARALYKNSRFIALDEPTAALDALAESELYSKFNDLIRDKTAIFVSHRLASTRFCDIIALFENGELVEYGSHDELMKKDGKYKAMFEVQAKYYQEGADSDEKDQDVL